MKASEHPGETPLLPRFPDPLQQPILEICKCIHSAGGTPYLVGGCVRDALLGLEPKDLDFEVFGLSPDALETAISGYGQWIAVGKAFGVYKIRHLPIDIALPRRERKSGSGHRGFVVEPDPDAGLHEAASRRDFTLNAISWDPLNERIEDPLDGLKDLHRRYLRHCGPQFGEDPLRVLRAMQMIARFDLKVDPETLALCRSIPMEDLPPERVFDEWKKLLLVGVAIKRGLDFLKDSGWLRYFPELEALVDCPQDPEWHPEGDVWTHTGHCLDAFARHRIGQEWEDLVVGLAVLCHDLGKPATTTHEEGRIRSRGHPEAGLEPTRRLLARMTRQTQLIDAVLPLVREHHRPLDLFRARATDSAIRRLATRVHRIDRLVRVALADKSGRPPLPATPFDEGEWLIRRSAELAVENNAPAPIVKGRHLIDLGLSPSPDFKPILDACFEAQLDGEFDDLEGGLQFLDNYLDKRQS